jgi:AcrR family transcriptional regulator
MGNGRKATGRVSSDGDDAMSENELESADHRVRVARERRERMRARLLEAVMHVYAGHIEEGPPSVDSVIRQADVSRATFYKYFNSVEEAISALGRELVDEMIASLINLYNPRDTAFFRMTGAIQLFLLRSVIDPTWAAFVGRSDGLARDGELFRGITTHLAQSRESHLVEFKNLEAATTIAIGSLMEAIRHLAVTRNPSREYIDEVTVMILRGLGLDAAQAAETVRDRTIYIRGLAPDCLPWWRDPWR